MQRAPYWPPSGPGECCKLLSTRSGPKLQMHFWSWKSPENISFTAQINVFLGLQGCICIVDPLHSRLTMPVIGSKNLSSSYIWWVVLLAILCVSLLMPESCEFWTLKCVCMSQCVTSQIMDHSSCLQIVASYCKVTCWIRSWHKTEWQILVRHKETTHLGTKRYIHIHLLYTEHYYLSGSLRRPVLMAALMLQCVISLVESRTLFRAASFFPVRSICNRASK